MVEAHGGPVTLGHTPFSRLKIWSEHPGSKKPGLSKIRAGTAFGMVLGLDAAGTLNNSTKNSDAATKAKDSKRAADAKNADENLRGKGPQTSSKPLDTAAAARKKAKIEQLQKAAHNGQPGSSAAATSPPGGPTPPTSSQANSGAHATTSDTRNAKAQKAEEKKINMGNASIKAGPAGSGVNTAGGDLQDKTSAAGGHYQADQAKVAQKQDAIDAQVAELSKDSSKPSQEQTLEVLKAAQQLTQSYSQRWTEVNTNIANP